MFMKKKSCSDTLDLLEVLNCSEEERRLNKNTVTHYFDFFGRITLSYYLTKLNTALLDGIIEIDETHLYTPKKSQAPHRSYSLASVWLFGMKDRTTKKFLVIPLLSRKEEIITRLIRRFIKIGSQIYSDSFSAYVNNKSFPKESKLAKYKYSHEFVCHTIQFVSASFPEVHTNSIENLWKHFKAFLKNLNSKAKYLITLARFHFHYYLEPAEQIKFIMEQLCKNELCEYETLEREIYSNLYNKVPDL